MDGGTGATGTRESASATVLSSPFDVFDSVIIL